MSPSAQPLLADWPKDIGSPLPRARRRSRWKRTASMTAQQCCDVWDVFVKNLSVTRDPVARERFIRTMSVDGAIRFDLAGYGIRAVFRNDASGPRLYADQSWLQLWLAGTNQAIARAYHRSQITRRGS